MKSMYVCMYYEQGMLFFMHDIAIKKLRIMLEKWHYLSTSNVLTQNCKTFPWYKKNTQAICKTLPMQNIPHLWYICAQWYK